MIRTQVICDKCMKQILSGEPKLTIDFSEIFFDKGNPLKNDRSVLKTSKDYCKECGRNLLMAMATDGTAAEWIEDWIGEILVKGGRELV